MTPLALAPVLALLAHAAPEPVPLADAPASWRPAVERAREAAADFQQRLQGRLAQAMGAGGPAAAVAVCHEEAPRIAREVGAERKAEIGRTSDRLRSPGNAPPAWARSAVERLAGRTAAEVGPLAVDLGDRVGVLLPIAVKSACLACHGPAAGLSPKVKEALAAAYPADRATGYAEGDARGFTWVVTAR
jgi:hypothetical protein